MKHLPLQSPTLYKFSHNLLQLFFYLQDSPNSSFCLQSRLFTIHSPHCCQGELWKSDKENHKASYCPWILSMLNKAFHVDLPLVWPYSEFTWLQSHFTIHRFPCSKLYVLPWTRVCTRACLSAIFLKFLSLFSPAFLLASAHSLPPHKHLLVYP